MNSKGHFEYVRHIYFIRTACLSYKTNIVGRSVMYYKLSKQAEKLQTITIKFALKFTSYF